MPSKRHTDGFLPRRQHRGAWRFRSHGRIVDKTPLLPLGHRLGIEGVSFGQPNQARLTNVVLLDAPPLSCGRSRVIFVP